MIARRLAAVALGGLFCIASPALALELPARPVARVNDYAGVLSADARARLESQLTGYEKGTTRQMVVAIFPGLDDGELEDTSIRLADQWKIGGKKSSDGVLVTAFVKDRKLRIEVGYGLEGDLTDVVCARIIRQIMRPALQAGDWFTALSAGTAALEQVVVGGAPPADDGTASNVKSSGHTSPLSIIVLIILVGLLVFTPIGRLFLAASFLGGGSGWSSGGGGGGGGGGFGGGGGGSFGGGGASGSW